MENERVAQGAVGALQPNTPVFAMQAQGDGDAKLRLKSDKSGLSSQLRMVSSSRSTTSSMGSEPPLWTRSESQGARLTPGVLHTEGSELLRPPERAKTLESHMPAPSMQDAAVSSAGGLRNKDQGSSGRAAPEAHRKGKSDRAELDEMVPLIERQDSDVLHVFEDPRITYRSTVDPELIRRCTRGSGSVSSRKSTTEYSDSPAKEALESKGAVLGGSGEMLWPAMQPFQDLASMVYDVFSGSTSEGHNDEEVIAVSRSSSPGSDFIVSVEGSTIVSGDGDKLLHGEARTAPPLDSDGRDFAGDVERQKASSVPVPRDTAGQEKTKNGPPGAPRGDGDLPARLED